MKKILILLALTIISLALVLPGYARTVPAVGNVEGDILHTIQAAWKVIDEELSGDTQATALAVDELSKLRVDAAIAAASSGDENISLFTIPSEWNSMRFRSCNITVDSGNAVYELYLGTLGGENDCDLVYAGQLDFTSGKQVSTYFQIAFTSGGTYEPRVGDVVTGNASGETAVVVSKVDSASTWSAGTAAGTIQYRSVTGTFTGGETISIVNFLGVTQADVLTHTSTVIDFEWADTLVVTAASWGASWSSISPADDTVAEAELDVKNADLLVILTSTCTADAKLVVNGY